MYSRALDLGLNAMILTSYLEGEAKEVGIVLASIARQIYYRDQPLAKPCAVLVGGETTVTLDVYGGGWGGRNQELACSAALYLNGMRGAVLASIGSDGI
ncbi:MAG: glycerate kinase, partial [Thermofilum sp. ex4484_79]